MSLLIGSHTCRTVGQPKDRWPVLAKVYLACVVWQTVVAETFEAIVNDPDKDALILFYSPSCLHCKKLEPVYRELAGKVPAACSHIIVIIIIIMRLWTVLTYRNCHVMIVC